MTTIPATSGIYRIRNTVNGKFYIGSATNLYQRRHVHFHELRNQIHFNPKLQAAFNKHGEQAFAFEVIELVLTPFLIEREQFYLDTLQPFGRNGYNIAPLAGSALGVKHSLATRKKQRIAHIGKSRANFGRNGPSKGYRPPPGFYERQKKNLIIIDPDGKEYCVFGIQDFCKAHYLTPSCIIKVARGERKDHKGYKARFPE